MFLQPALMRLAMLVAMLGSASSMCAVRTSASGCMACTAAADPTQVVIGGSTAGPVVDDQKTFGYASLDILTVWRGRVCLGHD